MPALMSHRHGSVSSLSSPTEIQPSKEPFGSGVTIPNWKTPAKSSDGIVVPASADSTEVYTFNAGFLLSCDNETSDEPHSERKPGRNQSRRFLRSAVRLTRPKLVNDQRLDEDRALSDEACLKTRPGDQRAE